MYQYEDIILKLLEEEGIQVKIANDEVRCCCPFHKEDNPSFSINLDTGKYICFSGSCNAKGDIYSFVSKLTHQDYDKVKKDFQINLENLKYYNIVNNVLNSFEVGEHKKQNIIKYNNHQFIELKDLQDENKILKLINIQKDISDKVGLKICLSNPYYRRLVVPIDKNIYEFRDLTKKSDRKCLYESGIRMSDYLFSIIINKEDDSIFINEGTKDSMSVAGFGFNACCTFGVNISDQQIAKILKLGINKVYILRDNDDAGYKSAYSTYKKLKNFIDCKIIKYPKDFKYKDPNEIQNKDEFIELLKFNLSK